jgi:FHA domain
MLEQIYSFMVSCHKLGPAAFALKHPHPVFVVDPFAQADGAHFNTTSGHTGHGEEVSIAVIKKGDGKNSFGMMVTIGRAANNDIEIRAADVSKFHAYVMFDAEGNATLTDAGSTYGTHVGERRLKARDERAPLNPGDKVRVGSVNMTFHTPATFRDWLSKPD